MVAGVRFELTTFGLCDLTQLSLRVGLYLHPSERDARHPVSTPSSNFRGLVRYCPSRTAGLRFHRLWRVIFPHIAVRTPILPKRNLNHRSRSAGYELDDQTLSPIDSVALIAMRHPKSSQKGQVLDPCWTLERNSPELDVQHSARFQFRRSRISGITSRPYRSSATRVVSLNAVWPVTATFPSTRRIRWS